MEPKQLGTVNFNQSPAKMFQVIGSRFMFFIFIFSPSTPPILLYFLGPRHKNKLFPSFPWTVVGTAMLYWQFSDTLKSLRSWVHVELRRCGGRVDVSSLWLLEQGTAHITHFFPCGSGKSKWSCAGQSRACVKTQHLGCRSRISVWDQSKLHGEILYHTDKMELPVSVS